MISDLEAVVLGIVCEKPSYGYVIEATIQERNIRHWTDIAFSSIYYVLRRLENQGYVEASKAEADGRLRKTYRATPTGEKALKEKLGESLSGIEKQQPSFNLGVGFMGSLGLDAALGHLERRRSAIRERLETYREALERIEDSEWPFFVRGLYTRPIAMLEAEAVWLEGFIEEIRDHEARKRGVGA
jgi:DNA-binding PadR family transcriptional regulator